MQQEEKVLSPQESLRVIRETIDLAKQNVGDNGFHFLLWGWLVVLAGSLSYYLETVLLRSDHYMAWMVMVVIGLPAALIYVWRRGKRQKAENLVSNWYGMVWLSAGITMPLIIAFALSGGLSPTHFIMAVLGMAVFISGVLLRFRPLLAVAVVMWAGALLCLWLPVTLHSLVMVGAAVLGYLAPGYLLSRKYARHV